VFLYTDTIRYDQGCSGNFGFWGTLDGGTEGPERGAEARSAGAPRGWGLGRGVVAHPKKNFQKINVEIAFFCSGGKV